MYFWKALCLEFCSKKDAPSVPNFAELLANWVLRWSKSENVYFPIFLGMTCVTVTTSLTQWEKIFPGNKQPLKYFMKHIGDKQTFIHLIYPTTYALALNQGSILNGGFWVSTWISFDVDLTQADEVAGPGYWKRQCVQVIQLLGTVLSGYLKDTI